MKLGKSVNKMMTQRINNLKRILQPSNLPKLFVLLLIVAALYYVYKTYLVEGMTSEDDSETTPSKFDSDLGKGKKMVLFYAGWCGHCKDLKPVWDSAAAELNTGTDKSQWKLLKVNVGGDNSPEDATEEQTALAKKYKIQGYPTILIFNDGKLVTEYQGERTKEGIMKALS